MKKYILSALMLLAGMGVSLAQQTVAGTTYFLPKTALRFAVKVEKTTYTPGQFAMYAFRYMKKKDVALHPAETYRVVDIRMNTIGVPDSTKAVYPQSGQETQHQRGRPRRERTVARH